MNKLEEKAGKLLERLLDMYLAMETLTPQDASNIIKLLANNDITVNIAEKDNKMSKILDRIKTEDLPVISDRLM